jgi:hypothetical protein
MQKLKNKGQLIGNEFSEELIVKCKKLVHKRSGVRITDEQAERCLEKLARLAKLAYETIVLDKYRADEKK